MIGLDRASWNALEEQKRQALLKDARSRFYAAGADFVINRMNELPLLIEDLEARGHTL